MNSWRITSTIPTGIYKVTFVQCNALLALLNIVKGMTKHHQICEYVMYNNREASRNDDDDDDDDNQWHYQNSHGFMP
jgi:hypothetical protein